MISFGTKIYREGNILGGSGLYHYENFPLLFIKDESVKIENLDEQLLPVLQALQQVATSNNINGFIVTSGNDNIHKDGSYHYKNRAIDISLREAISNEKLQGLNKGSHLFNQINESLNSALPQRKDFDIVFEVDHIHIEYDPSENSKESTGRPSGIPDGESNKTDRMLPIKYIHSDPSIQSLDELVSSNLTLFDRYDKAKGGDLSVSDLESYDGGTGITNRERIELMYVNPDEDDKVEKWPLLKPGTCILLPPSDITRNSLAAQSINQVIDLTSLPLYQDKTLKVLSKNGNYRPAIWLDEFQKRHSQNGRGLTVPVQYTNALMSVWIYCKALDLIYDVTPFCHSVTTDCNLMSDGFSIELSGIDDANLPQNSKSFENTVIVSELKAKLSMFSRYISENDIVWIRFEELQMESSGENLSSTEKDILKKINKSNRSQTPPVNNIIPSSSLAGNIYDFMGLVKTVQQNTQLSEGSSKVIVSGQGLDKMWSEDEAVFRPLSIVQDSFNGNIVIGDKKKRGWLNRNFLSGQYNFLFSYSYRTVEDTLKFIMNMISNVGLLPAGDFDQNETDFFKSYSKEGIDRRTHLYNINFEGDWAKIDNELAKGLYQIIKLSVDKELGKLHLTDSSIANPSGTIKNLMQSTCTPPLAEMFCDTYMDTYHVVCRVPPFDKGRILEWLQDDIMEIDARNVLVEELYWNSDFYTWYELDLKNSLLGNDNASSLAFCPIVFLPEYVNLWGSKKFQFTSPYTVNVTSDSVSSIRLQAIAQMKFIIESTMYLPFTRRGTITLNIGDRRFKKGTWIRHKGTKEIFYVEGVNQSCVVNGSTVSRTTTLTVSRGMVERYVRDETFGYFNIVDLNSIDKLLKEFVNNPGSAANEVTTSAPVTSGVFEFFLKRQQFKETVAVAYSGELETTQFGDRIGSEI